MRPKTLRPGWLVLCVKFRHEKKIYTLLKEKEVDTFLPCITTIRQWSDRKKKIVIPLFPCYIFVNIKSVRELHKPLTIEGVHKYLQFGSRYARVSLKEINNIKLLIGSESVKELNTTSKLPKVGQIKRIAQGPLSGLECYVLRADNYNKIYVRVESLFQNITATIPNYLLEDAV